MSALHGDAGHTTTKAGSGTAGMRGLGRREWSLTCSHRPDRCALIPSREISSGQARAHSHSTRAGRRRRCRRGTPRRHTPPLRSSSAALQGDAVATRGRPATAEPVGLPRYGVWGPTGSRQLRSLLSRCAYLGSAYLAREQTWCRRWALPGCGLVDVGCADDLSRVAQPGC